MDSKESWNQIKGSGSCEPPETHRLCTNGCGFFGSAATMNLCSKCYRDFCIKEEEEASTMKKSLPSTTTTNQQQSISISISTSVDTALPLASFSSPSTANWENLESDSGVKNRCWSCKKRVGLTGFKCRCGSTFCSTHRYPEEHACKFDFKAVGRDAIAKANPMVKPDKMVDRF